MFDRTPKQKRAIEATGNILVSAAAGSGKTSVMTERICNLVADGKAGIEDILVLTFTDMAASEMKKRIYHQLYDLSIQRSSESLGLMAERAVHADISTVHSFCQRIIREKYHVLGLSPSFHVSSDKESKRLLNRCLNDLLSTNVKAKEKNTLLLYEKYGGRSGKSLSNMILSLYDAVDVLPEPEIFYENTIQQYDHASYIEKVRLQLESSVLLRFSHAREILGNLKTLTIKINAPKAEKILGDYLDDIDILEHLFKTNPEQLPASPKVMTGRFQYTEFSDDMKDLFKTNKEYVKKLMDGIHELDILIHFKDRYHQELSSVKSDTIALLNLVFELKKSYQNAKRKKNAWDFNDLEHFAYQILKDPKHADDFRYDYIFIDEYQDTNPLQEAIINLIKQKDNLFLVGDVKQSIYAFRHAEPKLFLEKQNIYTEHESEAVSDGELIRMNENFRSSPAVVNGINTIMGQIMTPDFGGIDYAKNEALVNSSTLSGGKLSVCVIDSDETLVTEDLDAMPLSSKEAEAYAVANQIHSIIGQPIVKRGSDKQQSIRYADIVVLLRELSTSGPIYKRVFDACGIPVDCEIGNAATQIPEIDVFTHLLKIILNPTDDIALLSVMRFPVFGFSSDDLATIRINCKDKLTSFYDAVRFYQNSNTDKLSEKISVFFEKLNTLKTQSRLRAKADFLDHCYHALGFEEILCASPKRSIKADMLKGFIAALCAETPSSAGLARLVSFLDDLKASGETLKYQAVVKSTNAIKMMTVHKSKGLEFPIVFLSGLDKSFYRETRNAFIFDKELGLGFKIIEPKKNFQKPGLIYQSIIEKKATETLSEEIRLLYVAMTRAENQLYLCGARKSLKNSLSKWLMQGPTGRNFSTSHMDLVLPAVLDKTAFYNAFLADAFLPKHMNHKDITTVSFVPPSQASSSKKNDSRHHLFNAFLERPTKSLSFGYSYPFDDIRDIPSKRSVSSIKENGEIDIKQRQEVMLSTPESSVVSGAEYGTAFHKYMQYADFSLSSESDIKGQLSDLVNRHILTQAETDQLSLNQLSKILSSEIIKRANRSQTVFREKTFSLQVPSDILGYAKGELVLIQGAIDLCFLENDAFVVVDYKTDHASKDVIAKRLDGYKRQISIYASAVTQLTGKSVKEKVIYMINHGVFTI